MCTLIPPQSAAIHSSSFSTPYGVYSSPTAFAVDGLACTQAHQQSLTRYPFYRWVGGRNMYGTDPRFEPGTLGSLSGCFTAAPHCSTLSDFCDAWGLPDAHTSWPFLKYAPLNIVGKMFILLLISQDVLYADSYITFMPEIYINFLPHRQLKMKICPKVAFLHLYELAAMPYCCH